MIESQGKLIVISGFSGAGKGTVVKGLIEKYPYSLSISATTRAPREGEEHGREYYFKTVDEFRHLIDYNGFIEWTNYCDNYYGTPRKFIEDEMKLGHDVILEIEVEGALNVRSQYDDAILIFITTPDATTLKNRLQGRGSEDEKTIKKRMNRAKEEVDMVHNYDYVIINDDLNQCIEEVNAVVLTEKNQYKNRVALVNQINKELEEI
jgi:guanylate kinase